MRRLRPATGLSQTQAKQNRKGMVLLLVLVALIIAATALVSVARQSHRIGRDAIRAKQELQQRWGTESLRRSLLPAASDVFDERDKALRQQRITELPPAELQGQVALGKTMFQFILADEDARANVNSLYHYGGNEKAKAAIRTLSKSLAAVALQPEVPSVGGKQMIKETQVPDDEENEEDDPEVLAEQTPNAFRSWGQVFNLQRVPNVQQATRRLSCWNSEAINIRRAEDDTIVEVMGVVLGKGTARRILEDYRSGEVNEIGRTIDRNTGSSTARAQLKRLVSESSTRFSLWVRSSRNGEVRDSFAVLTVDIEGGTRTKEIEYRGR